MTTTHSEDMLCWVCSVLRFSISAPLEASRRRSSLSALASSDSPAATLSKVSSAVVVCGIYELFQYTSLGFFNLLSIIFPSSAHTPRSRGSTTCACISAWGKPPTNVYPTFFASIEGGDVGIFLFSGTL